MNSVWDMVNDPDVLFALLCVAEVGVSGALELGTSDCHIQRLLDARLVEEDGNLTEFAFALTENTCLPRVMRDGSMRRVA